MFKKQGDLGASHQKEAEIGYLDDEAPSSEIAFSEIKRLIDSANTEQYGFESALLEFILCRFIQFGEDHNCDTLGIFRKLFTKFTVHEYFESDLRIDIALNLFEYVHVVEDIFLPHFTSENFVKIAVADYFKQKCDKGIALVLRFVVN